MKPDRTMPRLYANSPCVVAEGPRWNAADGMLYWVDVTDGKYLRHRDGDGSDNVWGAMLYNGRKAYFSRDYNVHIVDHLQELRK